MVNNDLIIQFKKNYGLHDTSYPFFNAQKKYVIQPEKRKEVEVGPKHQKFPGTAPVSSLTGTIKRTGIPVA